MLIVVLKNYCVIYYNFRHTLVPITLRHDNNCTAVNRQLLRTENVAILGRRAFDVATIAQLVALVQLQAILV